MKIKVDFFSGIVLFLFSIVVLFLPILNTWDIKFILECLMIVYTVINLIRFILNRKTKDFEGLCTSISCLFLFIILFFIDLNDSSLVLALTSFLFVILMSFIRLKKADYYHDKKNKMWLLELAALIVFIMTGLVVATSILLTDDGNIFMIGFLFFINGFIEIVDPIVAYIKK